MHGNLYRSANKDFQYHYRWHMSNFRFTVSTNAIPRSLASSVHPDILFLPSFLILYPHANAFTTGTVILCRKFRSSFNENKGVSPRLPRFPFLSLKPLSLRFFFSSSSCSFSPSLPSLLFLFYSSLSPVLHFLLFFLSSFSFSIYFFLFLFFILDTSPFCMFFPSTSSPFGYFSLFFFFSSLS